MLKLGKLAPKADSRTIRLVNYLDPATLPPLLDAVNWSSAVSVPWGMMENDQIGDCTCAGLGHIVMAVTARWRDRDPGRRRDSAMYETVGGYQPGDESTDNGATELDALNFMRRAGLAGVTLDAFADVDPANLDYVKLSVQLFGSAYVLKDWVTFTEVFGQPLRVGKYGPGATENDKRVLLNAVTNIGTDAGAVIPDSMVIEFTEARQSGSADLYERFCDYLDRQVSKAVLGQTLTTEPPRDGASHAAAQIHQTVRRDIMNSDARRLAATITHDLVKPIVDLNFGPRDRYPQFILGLPDDHDVKVFADTISELADRGLRVSQKTVLDKLGLPLPEEGEPVLAPARSPSASGAIAHAGRE